MVESLALNETCLDTKLRVIELHEFNKNMDKMGKIFIVIYVVKHGTGILVQYLVYSLALICVCCKIIKLKVRSDFPNVMGRIQKPWQSLYTGYRVRNSIVIFGN